MKRKAVGAVALAVALSGVLAVPAFAADAETKEVIASGGTASTAITGTIKPTTLSVTVPTTVAFDVDPGATAGTTLEGDKAGQFTGPSNFAIVNNSVVDVYAYVSSVAATDVNLTAKKDEVAAKAGANPAKIMVGVRDAAPASFDTETDWLTSPLAADAKYYAFNVGANGKLLAKDPADASGTQTSNKATMHIFGQVPSTGWANGDKFTVTPTFTITVTDPATPAS